MTPIFSPVALSCLFTKGVAAKTDHRQKVQARYSLPDMPTRLLCAQLVLEEALETIKALGFGVVVNTHHSAPPSLLPLAEPDLEGIIDGCCDTIYVATGTLMACGVPDLPHLAEVCRANDSKFPGGVATINPATGKYLKPPGWQRPDHLVVQMETTTDYPHLNLAEKTEILITARS